MKTFEYKGFRHSGEACSGLVEALDLKEAREKLAARGVLAERVVPAAARRRRWYQRRRAAAFDLEARAMAYREMGDLLQSGLPLAQALQVLIDVPEMAETRVVLAALLDHVREGMALADALGRAVPRVTAFERAVLEVAERTGSLGPGLLELAAFLEEQQQVQERLHTALIYPAIVVALASGIAVVMLGVMVPTLARLLAETQVELPALTRFMLGFGRAVGIVFFPAALVLVLLAGAARRRWTRDASFRARADALLFRLPLWRRGYTALVNLRFARTLSLLLRGGVQLVEGVELAGRATGSPWVTEQVLREADAIRHGEALAAVIRRVPPLSGSLPAWIQAGESSGNLEGLLRSAAERFRRGWERFISRSLTLLEPLLILIVGLFVLLVALAILLPIFSLNRGLM